MSKSELKRLCAVDPVEMAEKMATQEEELAALREKCEERQRQLDSAKDMRSRAEITRDEMMEKYFAEKDRADGLHCLLKSYREEAAKQEPVAKAWRGIDGIHFSGSAELSEACGRIASDPLRINLYRHPPNLPALIEQAKAEEREECAKVCEEIVTFPAWHGGQFEGYASLKTTRDGKGCAAAIRARSRK